MEKLMLELGLLLLVVVVMVLVLVLLVATAVPIAPARWYTAGKKLTVGGAAFFFSFLWLRMPWILAASGESGDEACAPVAKLVRVFAPLRRQAASS